MDRHIPGESGGSCDLLAIMRGMDTNQARVIELLREVHLIAFNEIERLNMRIAELEGQRRQPIEREITKPVIRNPTLVNPPSLPKLPEMLNDSQVAEYLNMSVASVRRWRTFRKGPKFLKIGSAVRYKREDVDAWLESCPWAAVRVKDGLFASTAKRRQRHRPVPIQCRSFV
jgi:excisionase family DNA binding protein